MKIVLILLIPLVFAKTKWVPAEKQEDLPPNLQSYLRFENGRFFIKNGSKIPILFENGQFALKFTKEKCRAGMMWFYTSLTARSDIGAVSERDFMNETGESELVVKSDGRSLLDNGAKWKLNQHGAFRIDENGNALVSFEIRNSDCDVSLSQGKVMVEKVEPEEPVADASTTVIIIVGCGIAVVVLATIGGFLGYWFGCRKKKKEKTEEERIEKPPAIVAKKESKEKPKPKPKSKKKVQEKEKEKLSKEKKSDDDEISDRTLTKNFKKKKSRFKKAAKKYRFDMVELGTVLNFVKIMGEVEVCSTRVVKDQSLKMIDIGGTYDFHDARIMDPLEVRLLSEMSQQASSIVEQMRFHARRIFKEEYGYDKVVPTTLRAFLRKPETAGFYQAAMFGMEFKEHFAKVKTYAALKSMPIQAQMCKLFDPSTDDKFLSRSVTLMKYRMLVQFKKLEEESIEYLQWPMNTYAKWFHENPGKFYLKEDELKTLEEQMTKEHPDLILDNFEEIQSLLR